MLPRSCILNPPPDPASWAHLNKTCLNLRFQISVKSLHNTATLKITWLIISSMGPFDISIWATIFTFQTQLYTFLHIFSPRHISKNYKKKKTTKITSQTTLPTLSQQFFYSFFLLLILIPYTSISNKLILSSTTLFQFHKTTIFTIDRAYMPITSSINLGLYTNLDFNATHIYGVNSTTHFTHVLSPLFYLT